MKECKTINFMQLIQNIRKKFGDENLFLTFLTVHTENDIYGKRNQVSTFAKDNIDEFDTWSVLMRAKQISGSIERIAIVARVFLKEKIEIINRDGKTVNIPKKEIYHFLATKHSVISFNKEETMKAQGTDFNTKKLLLDEPGAIIKSSEEVLTEIEITCK